MKAAEYRRMFAVEDRQWWYVGMREISRSMLGTAVTSEVGWALDAGCGTGQNLRWLGPRAVGVDRAMEALHLSRSRGVRVAGGELESLPFASGVFDLVTSFDVLYHEWVRDDRAAVAELVRVLRPGGLLFVRVPAFSWLRGAHDEEVLTRHRYTAPELRALLTSAGLEVVRDSYCNSLLLPLLMARRAVDRVLRRQGSDVGFLPAPLEWAFLRALRLEAWWLRRSRLPLGVSVAALARRPTGT